MTEFEVKKLRADNIRNAYRSASVIFGPVFGFLIATGLNETHLSWSEVGTLGIWLFTLAGMAHNLLKLAENIVWHVPLLSNLIVLLGFLIPAVIIGFFQNLVAIDSKIWVALIVAWVSSTLFFAVLERPKSSEWS